MGGELASFREVVLVDFEFASIAGERPMPVCLVAHELKSGRRFRVWLDTQPRADAALRDGS